MHLAIFLSKPYGVDKIGSVYMIFEIKTFAPLCHCQKKLNKLAGIQFTSSKKKKKIGHYLALNILQKHNIFSTLNVGYIRNICKVLVLATLLLVCKVFS